MFFWPCVRRNSDNVLVGECELKVSHALIPNLQFLQCFWMIFTRNTSILFVYHLTFTIFKIRFVSINIFFGTTIYMREKIERNLFGITMNDHWRNYCNVIKREREWKLTHPSLMDVIFIIRIINISNVCIEFQRTYVLCSAQIQTFHPVHVNFLSLWQGFLWNACRRMIYELLKVSIVVFVFIKLTLDVSKTS